MFLDSIWSGIQCWLYSFICLPGIIETFYRMIARLGGRRTFDPLQSFCRSNVTKSFTNLHHPLDEEVRCIDKATYCYRQFSLFPTDIIFTK